jgi:hypothetical protein
MCNRKLTFFLLAVLVSSVIALDDPEAIQDEPKIANKRMLRRPAPAPNYLDSDSPGDGGGGGSGGDANPETGEEMVDPDGDKVVKKSLQTSATGFTHAFVATLSVIVVSELGDKTFFIAAIMAMTHSRTTVFAGAIAALSVMHVMSALLSEVFSIKSH